MGSKEDRVDDPKEGYCPAYHFGWCEWDEHKITLNPENFKHPAKLLESFFHELFHAINHVETSRETAAWWLPHSIIYRLSKALAKWMFENNLELVVRKKVPVPEIEAKSLLDDGNNDNA